MKKLKRWAWFLIKPFHSEELFWICLNSCVCLCERFSQPDQIWLIQSFQEQCATYSMFHSFRRATCMHDRFGWWHMGLQSTASSAAWRQCISFQEKLETYDHNTVSTAFPYEAYWTKMNCSHISRHAGDAPAAVLSSPSGSSVESSWEIHVATLLFAFYWIMRKFEIVFLLYYRGRLFLFFLFSFSYTVYGNKLYHLTVFEMNVLT